MSKIIVTGDIHGNPFQRLNLENFPEGKTYTKDTPKEELQCCTDKVFHFCRELSAIERESDYRLSESRLFEVIAGDYVRSNDKYGTNSLTILREICGDEKEELLNSGDYNIGNHNSGNWNTGNHNSGNFNTGSCNCGNHNSGDWNTGYFNTDEPFVRMFNKDTKLKRDEICIPQFCFFALTVWVSGDNATEEESNLINIFQRRLIKCG